MVNGTALHKKAIGLPFSDISVMDDSLHLTIKMISGSYEGKFIGNDSLAGTRRQGPGELPLNFSRSPDSIEAKKQTSFHPREKELAITSSRGSLLYGILLSKNKNQKLAIIIAGSGPTDRDGNNPLGVEANSYQLLAYGLDSQNIATFRYDKCGVGKSIPSGFEEHNLVFEDYIKDAENIFDYLHDSLGFKKIYFMGHSEGSLIGIIASQEKEVKGFISVAGAGRPIDIIVEEQMNKQPLPDSLKNKVSFIVNQLKKGKVVEDIPESLSFLFRKSVQPYFISWLKYSPGEEIKQLKCPVFILQGGCDMQVKAEDAHNLHHANKKSILHIIPSMTHTLKDTEHCQDQNKTYTDGSLPVDQTLVNDIANFIKK